MPGRMKQVQSGPRMHRRFLRGRPATSFTTYVSSTSFPRTALSKDFRRLGKVPHLEKEEEDDDHDQDPLTKDLLHIWSWSSESWLLVEKMMIMIKRSSRKICYTYGHDHLKMPIELFRGRPRAGDNFTSLVQVLQTLY